MTHLDFLLFSAFHSDEPGAGEGGRDKSDSSCNRRDGLMSASNRPVNCSLPIDQSHGVRPGPLADV